MQTDIARNKSKKKFRFSDLDTYNLRLDAVDPIPDLDRHQNVISDPETMPIRNTAYIHSCLVMFSLKCTIYKKDYVW
jgi:hypothetical protein